MVLKKFGFLVYIVRYTTDGLSTGQCPVICVVSELMDRGAKLFLAARGSSIYHPEMVHWPGASPFFGKYSKYKYIFKPKTVLTKYSTRGVSGDLGNN